jgi:hypothetical protein
VNKETRLAANALSVPIVEPGEIYTAVLLTSTDIADYRMAWHAMQHDTSHQ